MKIYVATISRVTDYCAPEELHSAAFTTPETAADYMRSHCMTMGWNPHDPEWRDDGWNSEPTLIGTITPMDLLDTLDS